MRIARIAQPDGARYAVWEESAEVGAAEAGTERPTGGWVEIEDPVAPTIRRTGRIVAGRHARLLAPLRPQVIVGVAFNARGAAGAEPPRAFLKSPRAVIGPEDAVPLDPAIGEVIVEGELAVVMGRDAHRLTEEDALEAVLGYTVANDITAIDQLAADAFWTQAKNGPGFAPLGPWIETELDPGNARIAVRVNDRIVAESSTSQLRLGVAEQLVQVTRHLALGPGDVVMCGSPGTAHPIRPGDRFAIEVPGLGTLSNHAV